MIYLFNSKILAAQTIIPSGFRAIMMLETSSFLHRLEARQFSIFAQKFHNSVLNSLNAYQGAILQQDNNSYLVTFKSVTNAVLCAYKVHANFKYITPSFDATNRKLHIGICSLAAVEDAISREETKARVRRMCEFVKEELVISTDVKLLYEEENRNARIDKDLVRVLKIEEETLLGRFLALCEEHLGDSQISVAALGRQLGQSPSQFNRKIKRLTGKSPGRFVREFRLRRALQLLYRRFGPIARVARQTGFKDPSYFTKCFSDQFGILPSRYARQHVTSR